MTLGSLKAIKAVTAAAERTMNKKSPIVMLNMVPVLDQISDKF
jgi:hypothetical protein